MEDYYKLLGLEEAYFLDAAQLRAAFLQAARGAHPDHHAAASEQANATTAAVNAAYQTLRDPDKRLSYLLKKYGHLDAAGGTGQQLPPEFLLEMMELNESIGALALEPDAETAKRQVATVEALQSELQDQLDSLLLDFDSTAPAGRSDVLAAATPLYLKQRYVLRLLQQVRSFAG